MNWIKLWWKTFQAKRNLPKFKLEKAFLESEAMGCRDSAETLVLNCLQIWERFGWWRHADSTTVVKLHNALYAVLGNSDRAAMVALGVVSQAFRHRQSATDLVPSMHYLLSGMCARNLKKPIHIAEAQALAGLFPQISRELRFRDNGMPTAEQVLIWLARS